jgi:PAS domain S-box-containing protein
MRQAFPSEIGCVTRARSANTFTTHGPRRIMAAMKESAFPGTHLAPSFGEDSTLAAGALEQSAVRLKQPEASTPERAKPTAKEAYRKDLETFFTHPDDSKILGRGSEHVVYEIASPEFAGNVYKINTEMSKGAIRELLRELDRPEEERDENFARKILDHWSESWTEEQGERKAFLENLRNRLGEEAVPKQQFLQQMMPRDFFDPSELFQDEPQMLERIKRLDEQERMPFRFPAWTSVQRLCAHAISNLVSVALLQHQIATIEEDLHDANSLRHALFMGARDAILISDAESGHILDANPQAEKLFGRELEQLLGILQAELHASGDTRDTLGARELLATLIELDGGHALRSEVIAADGKVIPVEITGHLVRLEKGKKVVQGVFRPLADASNDG